MPNYSELKIVKAYLVDYNTAEKLEFQYNPNEWEDNRTVQYAALTIPGISNPVYQFISGGERIIKFTLTFNAMYDKNCMEKVHWIRARTYPERSDIAIQNSPHKVVFAWPNSAEVLGIITQADRKIKDHFPDGRMKIVDLEIEIKESLNKSASFQMVR